MERIKRTSDNLFDLPKNAIIFKNNRVYVNKSNFRVEPTNGKKAYTGHLKVCIWVLYIDEEGNRTNKFYANEKYHNEYLSNEKPLPPERADSLSIGNKLVVDSIIEEYKLKEALVETFGEEDSNLILDLSMYMLIEEKAVFQHFPAWARANALYSTHIRSDSYISNFLKNEISYSSINKFKSLWAKANVGNGEIIFAYDSTNVNSKAEGIYIVQKGYAKDDPDLPQVNTDYVVREKDGLPLTFKEFPGSVVDIAEASEMIDFIKTIKDDNFHITFVCDRGYISENNIENFDESGIDFILLLKSNMKEYIEILNNNYLELKNNINYYDKDIDSFGMTLEMPFFTQKKLRYFHLVWNKNLEIKDYNVLMNKIKNRVKLLDLYISKKKLCTKDEIAKLSQWHILDFIEDGTIKINVKSSKYKEEKAFRILSYKNDIEKTKIAFEKTGFYILVSSKKTSFVETKKSYEKRNCVELVFKALKSSLGMDKIGTHYINSLCSKILIWFVSSILYSALFNKTRELRKDDSKSYTIPAIIDRMKSIVIDRDLLTNKYIRRYRFDKKQMTISEVFSFTMQDVDKIASEINEYHECD